MKIGLVRPTLATERTPAVRKRPRKRRYEKRYKDDLRGMRYCRISVIRYAGLNRFKDTLWLCRCDCGRRFTATRSALLRGAHKTCGKAGCRGRARRPSAPLSGDFSGMRFGRCVAIRFMYRSERNNHIYWECRCDCGNVFVTQLVGLRHGKTLSCGLGGCKAKSRKWRMALDAEEKKTIVSELHTNAESFTRSEHGTDGTK